MISPRGSPRGHRALVVRRFKLIDVSGNQQPSFHRPLRTEGTPNTKGVKALQSMLNLPSEAAARAVQLFDSEEAETRVHAADTVGNPDLVGRIARAAWVARALRAARERVRALVVAGSRACKHACLSCVAAPGILWAHLLSRNTTMAHADPTIWLLPSQDR